MRLWLLALLAAFAGSALAAPPAPAQTESEATRDAPIVASRVSPFAERRAQALRATREQRWKDALAQWQALAIDKPDDPSAISELGWALMQNGQERDARRQFQRALHLEPNIVRASAGLVALAIRAKTPEEAVRLATDTVRARPESAEAFRTLGDAQKAAARRSEAEDAYRRAVALDPNDAQNHAGLAGVLFVRNKSDEAVKEYRLAIRLAPENADYQEGLGRAAMLGGLNGEAALAFATAMDLARQPNPDWARLDNLALLALDALNRASSAVHNGSEARQDIYDANTRILSVTDALSALPVIEKADPTTDPAMSQRALAYGLMGQAAASDLAALKKNDTTGAADAFVFREQARRALMAARAAAVPTSGPVPAPGPFTQFTPPSPAVPPTPTAPEVETAPGGDSPSNPVSPDEPQTDPGLATAPNVNTP
jgi:tetratricopeptide (TPR) repeat protein